MPNCTILIILFNILLPLLIAEDDEDDARERKLNLIQSLGPRPEGPGPQRNIPVSETYVDDIVLREGQQRHESFFERFDEEFERKQIFAEDYVKLNLLKIWILKQMKVTMKIFLQKLLV